MSENTMNPLRLRKIHASVMERCMRHHASRVVGIDTLLVSARRPGATLHLAAVYWTSSPDDLELPKLHEQHFYLDPDDLLTDHTPETPVEWAAFDRAIHPDGSLLKRT